MAGYFLTFEGPEGGGKTTQARRLADQLRSSGSTVLITREPGGTALGEEIRRLLLDRLDYAILAETEALLHTAARAQHVGEVIRPALEAGHVVICDRFVESTLAYQGGGRGLPLDEVRAIQRLATGGLEPAFRILLDLPVEIGLQRRFDAGTGANRLDIAESSFHDRVRRAYLTMAEERPDSWIVVDASQSPDDVAEEIASAILSRTPLLADESLRQRATRTEQSVDRQL